jgi:hypothetical protein
MNFAAVVPVSMLNQIQTDEYHLVVAPVCSDQEYFNFYVHMKGHIILDNGVAEGKTIPSEDLLQLAYAIGADEVIAPDVYNDMERTLIQLKEFMPMAQNYDVMVVLHAMSWNGFDRILKASIQKGVAALALPRVMTTSLGGRARLMAAERIRKTTDLPIHALGSTMWLTEGIDLARQGIVRGMDSSAPVVLGLEGQHLSIPYSGLRPPGYFYLPPTPQATRNLNEYRHMIQRATK